LAFHDISCKIVHEQEYVLVVNKTSIKTLDPDGQALHDYSYLWMGSVWSERA